jgi:hypothetical protein
MTQSSPTLFCCGVWFYVSVVFILCTYIKIDGFHTKISTFTGVRALMVSKTNLIAFIVIYV